MKMTRIILRLCIAIALVSTASATVPVVTNVVASQRASTKLVDIYYNVSDAEGDSLKIGVEVSNNAGQTYSIPASSLTGDYGSGITPGTGKHIVWNAGVDWDGEYSSQMRVKVVASDGTGLPGLAWSSEIPAGGFLMGQDGGAEGNGPSRHVNIPWSYWLSKYEITADQYSEFLNIALAAGNITRMGTTGVVANGSSFIGVTNGTQLIKLDQLRDVVWNINSFEAAPGRSNFPVRVNWYGAIAFAQHFGYDLPTDAEWEKAVRGPDHAEGEQHQVYPWGNFLTNSCANYHNSGDPKDSLNMLGYYYSGYPERYSSGDMTVVGYYNGNQTPIGSDMGNPYGIYDMTGNAYEWCRSKWVASVESYVQLEALTNTLNLLTGSENRVIRGGSCFSSATYYSYFSSLDALKCYYRDSRVPNLDSTSKDSTAQYYRPDIGFRVVRRAP